MKLTRAQKARLRSRRPRSGFIETLLLYAVVFILSELIRPKPDIENAKPAGLGDFQFPTATEGRVVPIIWGTVKQKGPNVVWYGDYEQVPIVEKVKTGLFTSVNVIRGYKYRLGVQFALCRGEVDSIEKMWIGDTEIDINGPITHGNSFTIDCEDLFGGDELGQGGVSGTLVFYSGTKTQSVSSYLAQFQQEGGDTPRYTGTCYIAPQTENIYLGNATQIKPWAFELKRIPDGLSLGSLATVNGSDANPANVIYEILTDTEWGLGFDPADIDTVNMAAVGTTLEDEGNGFSYIMDRPTTAADLLRLVEQQIDGVVYQDRTDGLWKINLARDDYSIGSVPEITAAKMTKLVSFSRGSWEDTTNQVRIKFNDRSDNYKVTYGLAQDMANVRVMQGANVSVEQSFPGVKDATLANFIAWRQLRTLSYPLAKATLELKREFFDLVPGDVVAFTNAELELTKLPMRVQRVNYGEPASSSIRVDLIQDVFTAAAPSFGDPFGTNWDPPVDDLLPFISDQQIAFEAPRAILVRDPLTTSLQPRLWAGARRRGVEVGFSIRQRNASGTPSGAYTVDGEAYATLLIGQLASSISIGTAVPTTSILVSPTPDSQTAIEAAFADLSDPSDLGSELVNLIVIDPGGSNEEFMLVSGAQDSGGNVELSNVYRGALDTVQRAHSSGEDVWLIFVGGNTSETAIPGTHNVDVKLTPFSATDEVLEADATTITLTMANRIYRPYPPSLITLEGTDWNSSTSLEANGSTAEDFAIDLEFRRRDYRTLNEVSSLVEDAASLDASFPAANSTTYELDVRDDPGGTNTLVLTETGIAGPQFDVLRLKILKGTNGALPTDLRFVLTARHTDEATSYTSRHSLVFDFSVTSALTGQFEFEALDTNDVSATYTATVNGTYSFTLSSAFTAGEVQYRLNGGSWTSLITAGNTSGSIVGVVSTDTIEIRHTSTDSDALKQLDMNAPGAGQDGFAVLFT